MKTDTDVNIEGHNRPLGQQIRNTVHNWQNRAATRFGGAIEIRINNAWLEGYIDSWGAFGPPEWFDYEEFKVIAIAKYTRAIFDFYNRVERKGLGIDEDGTKKHWRSELDKEYKKFGGTKPIM